MHVPDLLSGYRGTRSRVGASQERGKRKDESKDEKQKNRRIKGNFIVTLYGEVDDNRNKRI